MARSRGMVHGGNKKLWPQRHGSRPHGHDEVAAVARESRIHPPAPRDQATPCRRRPGRSPAQRAPHKFRDGGFHAWLAERPNTGRYGDPRQLGILGDGSAVVPRS
jgi:ribosomal protein L4